RVEFSLPDKGIAADHLDWQPLLHDRRHVLVEFTGDDLCAGLEQGVGQRAGAGAALENDIAATEMRRVDQPAQLILIMQEVLPEAMFRTKVAPGEQCTDFR